MITAHVAGRAFDALADGYDYSFTRSRVGEAQRSAVLNTAFEIFEGRKTILELNCGTGEDALRFAAKGWDVLALDASQRMIARGQFRKLCEDPQNRVRFEQLATENLSELHESFDCVFSNFSGLNCVEDLAAVASVLAAKTTGDGPLVICLSTRICIWETIWYLAQGKPRKAFRRWSGKHRASLQGHSVDVFYWSLYDLKRIFAPFFNLRKVRAIGLFVPPSYVEPWIAKYPRLLFFLESLDRLFSGLPLLRCLGDHVLLHYERAERTAA